MWRIGMPQHSLGECPDQTHCMHIPSTRHSQGFKHCQALEHLYRQSLDLVARKRAAHRQARSEPWGGCLAHACTSSACLTCIHASMVVQTWQRASVPRHVCAHAPVSTCMHDSRQAHATMKHASMTIAFTWCVRTVARAARQHLVCTGMPRRSLVEHQDKSHHMHITRHKPLTSF